MPGHIYTIEELMLDDSFVDYCLRKGTAIPSRWRTIIRENPDQQKTFEEAKRLVLALHGGLSRPEVNRQIEIVRRQIEGRKDRKGYPVAKEGPVLSTAMVITSKGQIKRRLLRTAVYSAIGMFILIAGILYWFNFRTVPDSPGSATQSLAVLSYYSPLGERKKIDLPDGSLVILNSNSSISITFTNKKREVQLKGDAFFRVAEDVSKPFTVYSEKIAATALGTEFYMHGQGNDPGNVQVDLLEGKLRVVNTDNPARGREIILNPGESGKYRKGFSLQKTSYDSLYLRSWIGGRITFDHTPVLTAFQRLESWYGMRIEVLKTGLDHRKIKGDYTNEPLQNILDIICFSTNSRYSIKDNKIIIE